MGLGKNGEFLPTYPIFLPFPTNFILFFFQHLLQCISSNFSQFPIPPHFPPAPPIPPHCPPIFPILPPLFHFPHFSEPLRLVS